jgi:hypothetical protein
MVRRLAAPAALVAVMVARAAAQEIDVGACAGASDAALREALRQELGSRAAALRLRVDCPDPDAIVVTVAEGARPPARRTLAVGDVTPDLRDRVVAVVVGETLRSYAPERPGPVAFGAAGLSRYFADGGALLFGARLGVSIGRLDLGVAATGASSSDRLGTLHPWVVDATVAWTFACARTRAVELCAAARLALGAAFATASPTASDVTAATVSGFFYAPTAGVALAFPPGRAGLTVSLEAGWAGGLVALADDREALRLAGPMVTLGVGARFRP